LIAFQLADELVLLVYQGTRAFPAEERYGLANQLRKSAVSVASNIVEGCGRATMADYLRFLDIAHGSARELEYQISLARRLGLLDSDLELEGKSVELSKVLNGLINSLR
jgi:four helix bundle protein